MHFLKTKLTPSRIPLRNQHLQFYRTYSELYERTVCHIDDQCILAAIVLLEAWNFGQQFIRHLKKPNVV
jgi:hypothetical protein